MKLQFEVIFKQGVTEVSRVVGVKPVDGGTLTVAQIAEQIPATEAFLEHLTGFRVHINQVQDVET